MNDQVQHPSENFAGQVRSRFGVLPNFFCTAPSSPGIIEGLWGFAKSAYLDNPLPSLFKERLFVHLSRFCEIRYCIVRHVGFLVGQGRPAGDASAQAQSVEQAIALLSRPIPDAQQLDRALALLSNLESPIAIPEPEAELEGALFDVLTILFVSPRGADRARVSITHAIGEATFEILVAFLAFIRTAHYWTQTHPTLGFEDDTIALMQAHPDLARLMIDTAEADWASSGERLRRALADLRNTSGALRSSEERYRALIMATSDMLYRMGPDWSEMHSLEGRGLLADTNHCDTNWMSRYIPEDERERVRAAIRQASLDKSPFELEHRVLQHDGTPGWVRSRAVPIIDENGTIVEWFGTAIDLTAQKNAEEALRQADRRKDEFLATLAHELRNPLAPLRNGLQIARMQAPDTALSQTIEMMERQVKLLVHLVDDLLDVSRITTGKVQLRCERVNLGGVLKASAEASRASIDARHHLLLIGPCDDTMTVHGDFDRLTQVFSNLLSNAAEYAEEAGTIQLRVRRESDTAVISISDTGIGIPAEDLSGIFEMFSQVRSHQGHSSGGLGVGLTLVRQLLEMHGGSVSAASAGAGKGSTFTVRLPLVEANADLPEEPAPLAVERSTVLSQRILVVDDNVDAASSLAVLLGQWGHTVITAVDGQDGVAKAATFQPRIAFLDLGMPIMNGFEAAAKLRALPGGARTILVALTGWGQAHDLKRTHDLGFDHHLLKPLDPGSLQQFLTRIS